MIKISSNAMTPISAMSSFLPELEIKSGKDEDEML